MPQCREAFINADDENDIHGDLSNSRAGPKKRKLRTNMQRTEKRNRRDGNATTHNRNKFEKGDCGHHPNSVTHCTKTCMNPFGLRSIFGRAKSYVEKCQAVKTSVALGWSPRAKNVQIPEGFGVNSDGTQDNSSVTVTRNARDTPALKVNQVSNSDTVSPNSMRTYRRVQALMSKTQVQVTQHSAYAPPVFTAPQLPTTYYPTAQHLTTPTISSQNPLHAYHVAPRYAAPPLHMAPPRHVVHPQHAAMVPPLQPYQQQKAQPQLQRPSNDDLIAAGMRYYATQAGHQDFR